MRRAEAVGRGGYLQVLVRENYRAFAVKAHRLVWIVLRGPIPDGLQINHRDGDKRHNHPDNLELMTSKQNCLHATHVLKRRGPGTPPMYPLIAADAHRLHAEGLNYAQIGRAIGVSAPTVKKALMRCGREAA